MNAPGIKSGPNNPMTTRFGMDTGLVSSEPNRSVEWFEQERAKIFRKSWLPFGTAGEIPEPGDYLVRDFSVLNSSLIVVRGSDGVIRGFHNACPHRGNKVARGKGNTRGFACGFHGWTFNTEGALVFVPDEEQFFDFDKADFCLKPVHVDVWEGFIFFNMQAEPGESLAQWVDEIGEGVHGYPFQEMECVGCWRAEVDANWKVVLDAFQEGYHVAFVHNLSAPDAFTDNDNPYCHLFGVNLYQRNRQMSVYAPPAREPSPTEALAFRFGATVTQGAAGGIADLPKGVNPERSPKWGFDIDIIFPNFRLLPGQGWYAVDTFWPVAVDKSVYEYRLYMPTAADAGQKLSQEFTRALLRDLLREDLSTVESVQAAIMSGVMPEIVLSDMEVGVRHAYKVVESIVKDV
ncbi:MAG: Rieske 2Fe-2S domain-containing protein [Gammaproteobacteria bacterium]|nr:Rieske 2Fe-2S domain-containing protein [Gammaproteobacteria bacterium]